MARVSVAVLLVLFGSASASNAGPFELIVPTAITVRTGSTTGWSFKSLLLNGNEANALVASVDGVFPTFQTETENPDIVSYFSFFIPSAYTLDPNEVLGHFPQVPEASRSLLGGADLIERIWTTTISPPSQSIHWTRGYEGTATLHGVVNLGLDVVQYTTLVTFVNQTAFQDDTLYVNSSQRIASRFEPTFDKELHHNVPEPSTLLILSMGALAFGRYRRALQ